MGWLGVLEGRFPALPLPVSRIELTFGEIQVVIKATGT